MDINSIKGTGLTSQSSREKLIHELKGLGIKNPDVLNLISNMPRHLFLDTALANRAYENVSPNCRRRAIEHSLLHFHMHILISQRPQKEEINATRIRNVGIPPFNDTSRLGKQCAANL